VTGAIVGTRNVCQANGVMRAAELQLSDKEISEIKETAAEVVV
jgi:aryl-alcohol dehydrogenase-like predicted oxidoreductase